MAASRSGSISRATIKDPSSSQAKACQSPEVTLEESLSELGDLLYRKRWDMDCKRDDACQTKDYLHDEAPFGPCLGD